MPVSGIPTTHVGAGIEVGSTFGLGEATGVAAFGEEILWQLKWAGHGL
jgi:hypothetical protein